MNIRLIAASAVLVGALVSNAYAMDARVPTKVHVSMAGVNFAQPAQVKTFYGRLKTAAQEACDSHRGSDLSATAADRQCAAKALDRAVAEVNQPTLLALHTETTGRTPPTLLAAK